MPHGYRLHGVSAHYGRSQVLSEVGLELLPGRVIALLGENGSGKSTLLKVLAGLVSPSLGQVLFRARPLGKIARAEAARLIGYLPQTFEPFFPATVRDIARLGRLPHRRPFHGFTADDARAVASALAEVDALGLEMRQIQKLSGGERQRVLLARVLAGDPEVLLLDEPTANLDPRHRLAVADVMVRRARRGALVVFPTHELDLVLQAADEAVLVKNGRVLDHGSVSRMLTPRNITTLFGVDARVSSDSEGVTHVSLSLAGHAKHG